MTLRSPGSTESSRSPAEPQYYQSVNLVAHVPGFIEKVLVDRGGMVKNENCSSSYPPRR